MLLASRFDLVNRFCFVTWIGLVGDFVFTGYVVAYSGGNFVLGCRFVGYGCCFSCRV